MVGIGNTSATSDINRKNTNEEIKKRDSNDVGWEFGELIKANDSDKLKCQLYGHKCSGGEYRIKQHIVNITKLA